MKNRIKLLVLGAAIFLCTSCGLTANMSEQEAYDFGYGIGSTLRTLIDN